MSSTKQFTFGPDGRLLVTADGADLLFDDGPAHAPRWVAKSDCDIIAVEAARDGIITVDAAGSVASWPLSQAEAPSQRLSLGLVPLAVAFSPDRRVAVAGSRRLCVVSPELSVEHHALPHAVNDLAFGGGVIAAAVEDKVLLLDDSGAVRGESLLPQAVRSVCYNVQGFFLASAGDRVFTVPTAGGEPLRFTRAEGFEPQQLTCSADGCRLGLCLEPQLLLVMALPSRDTVCQVTYGDRIITGIDFGPDRWLGIGLDHGDANKIDMASGAVHRSDPPPGRARRSWVLTVSADDVPAEAEPVKKPAVPAAPAAPAAPPDPAARGVLEKCLKGSPLLAGCMGLGIAGLGGFMIALHLLEIDSEAADMTTFGVVALYLFGGLFMLVGLWICSFLFRKNRSLELLTILDSSPGDIAGAAIQVRELQGGAKSYCIRVDCTGGRWFDVPVSAEEAQTVLTYIVSCAPHAAKRS